VEVSDVLEFLKAQPPPPVEKKKSILAGEGPPLQVTQPKPYAQAQEEAKQAFGQAAEAEKPYDWRPGETSRRLPEGGQELNPWTEDTLMLIRDPQVRARIAEAENQKEEEARFKNAEVLSLLTNIPVADLLGREDELAKVWLGMPADQKVSHTTLWERLGLQVQAAYGTTMLLRLYSQKLAGDDSPELQARIDKAETNLPTQDPFKGGFVEQAVRGTIDQVLGVWYEGAEGAGWMGLGMGSLGAVVGFIGGGVPGAGAGWTAALPYGVALGRQFGFIKYIAASNYRSILKMKDPSTGKPIDPAMARVFSWTIGAVEGILEDIQWEALFGGGAKGVGLSKAVGNGLTKLMTNKGFLATVTKWAARAAATTVEEVAEEAIQDVATQAQTAVMKEVNNYLKGTEFEQTSREERWKSVWDTIKEATPQMTLLGMLGVGGRMAKQSIAESRKAATEEAKKAGVKDYADRMALLDLKKAETEPWGKSLMELTGLPMDEITDFIKDKHEAQVKEAVEENMPVPIEVLKNYEGETWADKKIEQYRERTTSPIARNASTEIKLEQVHEMQAENTPVLNTIAKQIDSEIGSVSEWFHKDDEAIRATMRPIEQQADLSAIRTVTPTIQAAGQAIKAITANPEIAQVLQVDSVNMLNAKSTDWGAALVDVRLQNGQIVRIELIPKGMEAGRTANKQLADKWRETSGEYKEAHREEYLKDLAESRVRYDEAIKNLGIPERVAQRQLAREGPKPVRETIKLPDNWMTAKEETAQEVFRKRAAEIAPARRGERNRIIRQYEAQLKATFPAYTAKQIKYAMLMIRKAAEAMGVSLDQFLKAYIEGFKPGIQHLKMVEVQALFQTEDKQPMGRKDVLASPAFKEWFGKSVIKDSKGNPYPVYHGTTKVFQQFRKEMQGIATDEGWYGAGFYFTADPETAAQYAKKWESGSPLSRYVINSNIIPVYLKMENPFEIKRRFGGETVNKLVEYGFDDGPQIFTENLKKAGYDGVLVFDMDNTIAEYIVFEPEQIKSVFNVGQFSPATANILYSKDIEDITDEEWSPEMQEMTEQGFTEEDMKDVDPMHAGPFDPAIWTQQELQTFLRGLGVAGYAKRGYSPIVIGYIRAAIARPFLTDKQYEGAIKYLNYGPDKYKLGYLLGTNQADPETLHELGFMSDEKYAKYTGEAEEKGIVPIIEKGIVPSETIKGAVQFLEGGKALVAATEAADFSTFVHEMGHVFRRLLPDGDLKIIEKWAGVEEGIWTEESEEKFARGLEHYLLTSEAPSKKLVRLFKQFKEWLSDLVRDMGKEWMNPEVRHVYDRIFLTPKEQIQQRLKIIKEEIQFPAEEGMRRGETISSEKIEAEAKKEEPLHGASIPTIEETERTQPESEEDPYEAAEKSQEQGAEKIKEAVSSYEAVKDVWFGEQDTRILKHQVQKEQLQQRILEVLGLDKKIFLARWFDTKAPKVDAAIQLYIDTKRDPGAVREYWEYLKDDEKEIVTMSQNLSPELKAIADTIEASYKEIGERALDFDVINNVLENYAARIWDMKGEELAPILRKFGTKTHHAKHRVFTTIIEAWGKPRKEEWGTEYRLKIKGATANLQILQDEITRTIENKRFLKSLLQIRTADGEAVVTTFRREDYKMVEHPNFRVWKWAGKVTFEETTSYIKKLWRETQRTVTHKTEANQQRRAVGALEKLVKQTLMLRGMTEGEADNAINIIRNTKTTEGIETTTESILEKTTTEAVKRGIIKTVEGRNFFITEDGDVMEKREVYAQKEIAKNLNNILGRSKIIGTLGGLTDIITKFNAVLKAWILQTSFFHHLAYYRSYYFGTGRKKFSELLPRAAYRQGYAAIMALQPELMLGVKKGLTLGLNQEWQEDLIQSEGFLQRLLNKTAVTRGVKDVIMTLRQHQADFLFGKLGAGLKAKSFLIEYRNEMVRNPAQDPEAVAQRVARLINDDFGGLHLGRMGRNPTTQHIFRLVALAPDWTESNILSMIKVVTGPLYKWESDSSMDPVSERGLYQKFWLRVLLRGFAATALLNFGLAGGDLDKMMRRYRLAMDQGWNKMRWASLDITPMYQLFGGEGPERKYFSLIGHFRDPFKFMINFREALKAKASVMARTGLDFLNMEDWAGRKFTTFQELLETGQTVKWFAEKPHSSWEQLPSFFLAEATNMQPIQFQNLLHFMNGEMEGFDAITNSMGLGVTTTYNLGKEGVNPMGKRRKK